MQTSRAAWLAPRPISAVAVVALLVLIVTGLVVLIDMDAVRPFDELVIGTVRAQPLVAPFAWLQTATQLGGTWWVTTLAVLVGVVETALRRPMLGLAAAATIGLAALANSELKLVVARPRPDLLTPIVIEPGYSFPSGHSLSAMAAYGVIAVLVGRSALPVAARAAIIGLLGALIALIGLSRVYLGAHYPTDVIGGWLMGLAWVTLFAAFSVGIDPRFSGARGPGGAAAAADRAGTRSDPPAPG